MVILMTGTVEPNSTHVAVKDTFVRLQEYCEALSYCRDQFPGTDIYFLENSSFDLDNNILFSSIVKNCRIKVLRFPRSEMFHKGKGYQEFEMLDQAVERLKDNYDIAVKLTGRYKVMNLKQVLKTEFDCIMADCHRTPEVTQTNVFCFHFNFYRQHLSGKFKEADDEKGIFIEKVIYSYLKKNHLMNSVTMFPVGPRISGVSGSYGTSVSRNKWKMKIIDIERMALRIFNIHEFPFEI